MHGWVRLLADDFYNNGRRSEEASDERLQINNVKERFWSTPFTGHRSRPSA